MGPKIYDARIRPAGVNGTGLLNINAVQYLMYTVYTDIDTVHQCML